MALHISINTASSELSDSAIHQAILFVAAMAAKERQRGMLPSGPALDVTFLLPGKFERPSFAGMRMGGYTTEGETLFFETAVPEHILHSSSAPRYVAVVLEEMVEHAQDFFAEHQIPFEPEQWQALVARMTGPDSDVVVSVH